MLLTQFEVGKTYSSRSVCDHECIYSYKVTRRTTKTVWLDNGEKVIMRRVEPDYKNEHEVCSPNGKYSMSLLLSSNDLDESAVKDAGITILPQASPMKKANERPVLSIVGKNDDSWAAYEKAIESAVEDIMDSPFVKPIESTDGTQWFEDKYREDKEPARYGFQEYRLNMIQRKIVEKSGKKWKGGDDNDFSCFLSNITFEAFKAGDINFAWHVFQNDPLVIPCSLSAFCASMERQVEAEEKYGVVDLSF